MSRLLLALNPRPDFHAVTEGENHPAAQIAYYVIRQPVELLFTEIHRQFPYFLNPRGAGTRRKSSLVSFVPIRTSFLYVCGDFPN